jgi:hypothetical protein
MSIAGPLDPRISSAGSIHPRSTVAGEEQATLFEHLFTRLTLFAETPQIGMPSSSTLANIAATTHTTINTAVAARLVACPASAR